MSLAQKFPREVKHILAKYPPEGRRSAVMPLLYLAQQDEGYITTEAMRDIAQIVGITETDIGAIVGFYTMYHDKKEGKYYLQVCTDLPCALRDSEKFMGDLCAHLGIKVGETTPDGLVTLQAVTCLAACDRAPVFQTQGPDGAKYHENMTVDKTMDLVQKLKKSSMEVAE
jgi:NADH-quinone oxidoreductase subunit E